MEKVTSKHGNVCGFLSCFSSKEHWASLEFTTPIAFEFVSSISSGHFPRTTTGKAMKTLVPDRTTGLQFKLIFAQLLEHSRGVARIFPWGGPKYRFHNFCKMNVIWGNTQSPGGVGTFPNYLNGYVPPNRVVILERFRLLRNSVCHVASRLGKTLKLRDSDLIP